MFEIDNLDVLKLEQISNINNKDKNKYVIRDELWSRSLEKDINYIEQQANIIEDKLYNFGEIQEFLNNEAVSEIIINPTGQVWIEKNGSLILTNINLDSVSVGELVYKIAQASNTYIDYLNPVLDGIVDKKFRVNIIGEPVSISGYCITIRKLSSKVIPLECFGINQDLKQFLIEVILSGLNIIIIGATNSGKTSLIKSLIHHTRINERIVIVEDSPELQVDKQGVVNLQTKQTSGNSKNDFDLEKLVKASLRMRPDRVVIGEVRGKEAFWLLQAAITGHAGIITSIHGHDVETGIRRLAYLAMMQHEKLAQEGLLKLTKQIFDIGIVCKRRKDGKRIIESIWVINENHESICLTQDNKNLTSINELK